LKKRRRGATGGKTAGATTVNTRLRMGRTFETRSCETT
jgi:hypothetical protein